MSNTLLSVALINALIAGFFALRLGLKLLAS